MKILKKLHDTLPVSISLLIPASGSPKVTASNCVLAKPELRYIFFNNEDAVDRVEDYNQKYGGGTYVRSMELENDCHYFPLNFLTLTSLLYFLISLFLISPNLHIHPISFFTPLFYSSSLPSRTILSGVPAERGPHHIAEKIVASKQQLVFPNPALPLVAPSDLILSPHGLNEVRHYFDA